MATTPNEFDVAKLIANALQGLEEPKRLLALRWAAETCGIKADSIIGAPQVPPNGAGSQGASGAKKDTLNPEQSPKDFLKQKRPETDVERMACLAYYLTHHKKIEHFLLKDLVKLNTDAAGDKFTNPSLTASNAQRQSKFLVSAGGQMKQITAHGEEVVAALPDRAAVKELLAKKPGRKKRATKKIQKLKK